MKRFLSIFAITALAATSAQAQTTLLNDNFNSENGGNTQLSYNSFANWDVSGNVDLVGMPNGFGITCSGSCVDLDGTTGPGGLTTKIAYSFAAGDIMKISFDVGGSQRSTDSDQFSFGIAFTSPTTTASCVSVGFSCLNGSNFSSVTYTSSIAGNAAFSTRSLEFTAVNAGSVSYRFSTTSADNIGPLLDNVMISRTSVVPEPSTWALMVAGLGALGVAAGRRRA